jgi:hypothetical protein
VDILDITTVAYYYDTEVGDALYDPQYDFDDDGDIDILDITSVTYFYNWTCSKSQQEHPLIHTDNSNVRLHIEKHTENDGFLYYDIMIEEVEELGGFEFELEYNPNEIEVLEIQEGAFVGSTGRERLELQKNINSEAGRLNYSITTLGSQTKGASGSGTLFRIKCRAHSSDFSPPNLAEGQIVRIDAEPIPFEMISTGLDESVESISDRIISIAPNPFKERTLVHYSLEKESHISFEIYDVFGNYIFNIFEGQQKSGVHNMEINQENLSSGFYILFFRSDNEVVEVRKIIIEK